MTTTTQEAVQRRLAEIRERQPHDSQYEQFGHSPSGKLQGRCTICQRVTTGFEKRCWTLEMATHALTDIPALLDLVTAVLEEREARGRVDTAQREERSAPVIELIKTRQAADTALRRFAGEAE